MDNLGLNVDKWSRADIVKSLGLVENFGDNVDKFVDKQAFDT